MGCSPCMRRAHVHELLSLNRNRNQNQNQNQDQDQNQNQHQHQHQHQHQDQKHKNTGCPILKGDCDTPILLKHSFAFVFGNQLYSKIQTDSCSTDIQCALKAPRARSKESAPESSSYRACEECPQVQRDDLTTCSGHR